MVLVSNKPMNFIVLNDLIVMVMHFLHTGRKRHTLPGTEEPMTTVELITALFYEVDEQLYAIPKHPEAHLWPSEVVTLGLLHALKGVGNRPCSRWLTRDYRALFPRLPERTRLFRLLKTHQRRFSRGKIGAHFPPQPPVFFEDIASFCEWIFLPPELDWPALIPV